MDIAERETDLGDLRVAGLAPDRARDY